MIDLYREMCKPVLKLDIMAHGISESLSEISAAISTLIISALCVFSSHSKTVQPRFELEGSD